MPKGKMRKRAEAEQNFIAISFTLHIKCFQVIKVLVQFTTSKVINKEFKCNLAFSCTLCN